MAIQDYDLQGCDTLQSPPWVVLQTTPRLHNKQPSLQRRYPRYCLAHAFSTIRQKLKCNQELNGNAHIAPNKNFQHNGGLKDNS